MIAVTEKPTIKFLTQDDLPYDDNENMETSRHKNQLDLLLETIYPWLEKRKDGYAGGNMFVYYSLAQVKNKDYKGPDFFCVLDVGQKERKSWVCWEEGKAPNVVIELLSESTADYDKIGKKLIYQNEMRVPEYFWYDPFDSDDWAGFSLVNGRYKPLKLDSQNRYISQQLQLALVRWKGVYRGVDTVWLRWQTLEGELLPTDKEVSDAEKQRAETEKQRADQAELEINRLKALLQNSGIEISD